MSRQCFDVAQQGHVAHIVLNRPDKRNSMVSRFWQELPEIVDQLCSSGTVRAIVLSSTGPHFSSGMDVSVFSTHTAETDPVRLRQRAARFRETVLRLQSCFTALEECPVPVLAAVQGGCIGAGLDMVTACDMRYATKDAFFTIFETNLAMTADVGTFPRLCKLMPDGIVRELAYTGRRLSAAEACEYGLVNRLFDTHQEMLEEVMNIGRTIAEKAPLAVHGCKQMVLHARDHSVADTLDYVALWNAAYFQRDEIVEAIQANADKRSGKFAPLPARPLPDDLLDLP